MLLKNERFFPNEESAKKVIFMAVQRAAKKMDYACSKVALNNEQIHYPF